MLSSKFSNFTISLYLTLSDLFILYKFLSLETKITKKFIIDLHRVLMIEIRESLDPRPILRYAAGA
jgi:hypothetical protein